MGTRLCARLTEAGETVRILAHPRRKGAARGSPHEIVWGDIRDTAAVDRAVRGAEAVFHLVSNFRRGGSDEKEAFEVNVGGTRNVLEASTRYGVGQVIHCSTIGVHGSVLEIPADEGTPFNPLDLYQETKVQAEQAVWKHHGATGLPVTIIRPISIFGPGDTRLLKLFRMIQKRRFVMIGDGSALFHPAYIDDVVEGFQLSLRNPKAFGEVFIVGGDEYMPLRDLVAMIAAELGVRPPHWRLPLRPVLVLANVCEKLFVPLGLEPPLHRRRVSFFQNNRAFAIEKARRVLGFQPRMSLRDSIRTTIGWYRRQGWLA